MTLANPVRNPRTGKNDYFVDYCAPAEIGRLVEALRAGQKAWRDSGIENRISVMLRWGEAIAARREELLAQLCADTGRYRLSVGEVDSTVRKIKEWCDNAPTFIRQQLPSSNDNSYIQQLVPYPVLGVISPWNFPLTLALIDAIPALLAGCSCLIKPSEVTPRFTAVLAETVAAVPELQAVLKLVQGDGQTGAAMVETVDMICFTGSVATGRKVGEAAARQFIPVQLELGGKDAAIVTETADIKKAADALLCVAMLNAGQICWSVERIYVQRTVYDQFVEHMVAQAKTLRLNTENIRDGDIGPLIFPAQAKVIEAHLADAKNKGAKILVGGEIEDHGGIWCQPTVVVDVDHSMKLMTEETFGPVAPIMAYDSVDEAVALANDSAYGLSASVFAGTQQEGLAIAERINAGGISINDAAMLFGSVTLEKHGFNYSGMGGSRRGPEGLLRFYRKKALMTQFGEPRSLDHLKEQ